MNETERQAKAVADGFLILRNAGVDGRDLYKIYKEHNDNFRRANKEQWEMAIRDNLMTSYLRMYNADWKQHCKEIAEHYLEKQVEYA